MKITTADWLNGSALLISLVLATAAATAITVVVKPASTASRIARLADDDATSVVDARGHAIPIKRYQRIVSLNTVADQILLNLVSPDRLLSVTGWSMDVHPEGWRFGNRARIAKSNQLESVINQRPDVVIVSNFAEESYMERLREAGIAVFDLGETLGVTTTRLNIRSLGALVGERARAERLLAAFERDLTALAVAVENKLHPVGMYLTVYQDTVMGGTTNTSYEDLLRLSGIIDLAAKHNYRDWPTYSPEQLLAMGPSLIVTQPTMAKQLCSKSQLATLPACGPNGQIIELGEAYHSDPGLGLVEAVADLQRALWGNP